MKSNWKAVVIAPLIVPAILAGLLAGGELAVARNALFAFLFFFAIGAVVSYGATVCLLMPSLYLLAKVARPTFSRTCLLGAALGVVVYLPLLWVAWRASGPDSGPPEEGLATFALRFSADPLVVAFPLAGMVTAALYWILANRP